ncbi:hypothetical protein A2U01_0063201 [Trifolium medium]|uniref:Uncharacterized protein n=1 Tax=Trifolium medium TaxID=97028 RepID=A0A392S0P3_9FABA|nr:hypothetical protein [Trifolium medium]
MTIQNTYILLLYVILENDNLWVALQQLRDGWVGSWRRNGETTNAKQDVEVVHGGRLRKGEENRRPMTAGKGRR